MGQSASTGPAAQLHLNCCQPAVSGDTSPVAVARGMGESLPNLLSTPTAGAQNGVKKGMTLEDTRAAVESTVSGHPVEEIVLTAEPAESGGAVDLTASEVNFIASDSLEFDAANGPNRASSQSITMNEGITEKEDFASVEEADATTATQEQTENQPEATGQPAKRTREERKELRRQQRGNAKERLHPFLSKNGFVGPNTPRRRFFRTQFPIHAAVNQNNAEVVKLLIIAGVDITKVDSAGRTAQELARREHSRHNSHAQVLALLTEAQRRRAARMARKNQAAEGAGATSSGQVENRASGESSLAQIVTSSTMSTMESTTP